MIKRLTKHGNSLALVIDRRVLELLDIRADTPLSLTTDGNCLVVAPVRDARRRKLFRRALEAVCRRHHRALKRLAD
jgi:antitoxin component of MazEF toxin-antitoxin module